MPPRKPGAKAIVVYRGKLLLALRDNIPTISYPNTWNMPGGGIEANETPEQAIVRELQEEINLNPSNIVPLGTTTYSDNSLVYRFLVRVADEEFPSIKLLSEGQKLAWFTYDELLALAISPHSFTYYTTHEQHIRDILDGNDPIILHENLDIMQPQ